MSANRGLIVALATGFITHKVTNAHRQKISSKLMPTRKTTKPASASTPFRAADHLRSASEIAVYIEEMLADGDARAVPVALRTVADALGGMGRSPRRPV